MAILFIQGQNTLLRSPANGCGGGIVTIARLFLLAAFVCGYPSQINASPQVFPVDANKFLVKKWTTEDGLPQNTVTSMIQTRDGYYWVGTFGGLARFDGIKFTVFDTTSNPEFKSTRVTSLFEDDRDQLWIGTDDGNIYVLRDGHFALFSEGLSVRGTVWDIKTDNTGRMFFSSDLGLERFTRDASGEVSKDSGVLLSRERTFGLFNDPKGDLWVRIQGLVFKIVGDHLVNPDPNYYKIPRDYVLKIDFTETGAMILGEWGFLGVTQNGSYQQTLQLDPGRHQGGFAVKAHNGSVWFQQSNELIEVRGTSLYKYDLSDLVSLGSRAIYFDREGDLWLATQADGIVRIKKRTIGLVSDQIGEELLNSYALLEGKDGEVWICGNRRLIRLKNGEKTVYSKRAGNKPFPVIKAMALAPDGVLWVGGALGLYSLRDGVLTDVEGFGERDIYSLTFGRDSTLWVGTEQGLYRYRDGSVRRYTTKDGLSNNNVHRIAELSDGSLWIGTRGGISRISDGEITGLTFASAFSGEYIRDLVETEDGAVWVGTYGGGLARLKDGDVKRLTSSNGLPNNYISRMMIGKDRRMWILSNLGVFAASIDDLNNVVSGKSGLITGSRFGTSDGMPSSEANGGHQYAGIVTRDGRAWFPMLRDIVVIDTSAHDSRPPRPVIERASVVGSNRQSSINTIGKQAATISIVDSSRNLQIDFTGLGSSDPETIRFLYKLEGLDNNWIDSGYRRTAFYPYLPPGDYEFTVKAVSADGVESETPAKLRIEVEQRFWESPAFVIIIASLIVGSILFSYRRRLNRIKAEKANQAEFSRRLIGAGERERARISKDIHDGLGQQLVLIKNWAAQGRSSTNEGTDEYSNFDKIFATATGSIGEIRTVISDMAPQNLVRFGLKASIENMIEQIEQATGIRFQKAIDPIDELFSPEVELSIYRIIQEALNNIIKHSDSPRAKVEIVRDDDTVRVEIADVGKGFDVNDALSKATHKRGFGLVSIVERTKLLGGELKIDSSTEGTSLRIEIKIT